MYRTDFSKPLFIILIYFFTSAAVAKGNSISDLYAQACMKEGWNKTSNGYGDCSKAIDLLGPNDTSIDIPIAINKLLSACWSRSLTRTTGSLKYNRAPCDKISSMLLIDSEKINDNSTRVQVLLAIQDFYQSEQEWNNAMNVLIDALPVAQNEQENPAFDLAYIHQVMGHIHWHKNEQGLAEHEYIKSFDILEKTPLKNSDANSTTLVDYQKMQILQDMLSLYLEQNKSIMAKSALDIISEIYSNHTDKPDALSRAYDDAVFSFVEHYIQKGQCDVARPYFVTLQSLDASPTITNIYKKMNEQLIQKCK